MRIARLARGPIIRSWGSGVSCGRNGGLDFLGVPGSRSGVSRGRDRVLDFLGIPRQAEARPIGRGSLAADVRCPRAGIRRKRPMGRRAQPRKPDNRERRTRKVPASQILHAVTFRRHLVPYNSCRGSAAARAATQTGDRASGRNVPLGSAPSVTAVFRGGKPTA